MIRFFTEDIDFTVPNPIKLKRWLSDAATYEGKSIDELNYIFCSDAYLLGINQAYLQHDTLTDIITFPTSEFDGVVSGDVFISVERVRENATIFNEDFVDELHRVLVHGLLHLCGHKDKTKEQSRIMRILETFHLSKWY